MVAFYVGKTIDKNFFSRAISENRTHDPFPTKEVLYP